MAQIQIENDFLTSSFSILEEQPMDMLLGNLFDIFFVRFDSNLYKSYGYTYRNSMLCSLVQAFLLMGTNPSGFLHALKGSKAFNSDLLRIFTQISDSR